MSRGLHPAVKRSVGRPTFTITSIGKVRYVMENSIVRRRIDTSVDSTFETVHEIIVEQMDCWSTDSLSCVPYVTSVNENRLLIRDKILLSHMRLQKYKTADFLRLKACRLTNRKGNSDSVHKVHDYNTHHDRLL